MLFPLIRMLDRLDTSLGQDCDVIRWGAPIPSFGNPERSGIATMGINPSNREFVDGKGRELKATSRRFHTLSSLGLSGWSQIESQHLACVTESCERYFSNNPYDGWFKKLERVLVGIGASYYESLFDSVAVGTCACHLDLVPYATSRKWGELPPGKRLFLLELSADTVGILLRDSSIRILILNGQTVVNYFEKCVETKLERMKIASWALPRYESKDVQGVGYMGHIHRFAGVGFDRDILVLGFNHNIQSSYGVTNGVLDSMRDWVTEMSQWSLS